MEDTLHKVYFDCMEPETIVYRFGSQTVSLRKFGLNLLRLAVRLSAFRPVGSLESGWSVRSYGPPRSIADRFMANLRRGAQET